MALIPAFSEPQSHWPRVTPSPALGQSGGEARAAGVDPWGNPPTVPPHPERIGIHPRFRHPSISQTFDIPCTKIELSRVGTASHGVETSVPRANR